MTVDDEILRRLEEKASNSILGDLKFREKIKEALEERGRERPADIEAGLRRASDLASYRLRRYLSGRSFSSPLSVMMEAERILSSVKADIIASLHGQTPDSDSVAQQILRKLREDLELVEELETFANTTAKKTLFQAYLENDLEGVLQHAPLLLRESQRAEDLERNARITWLRLLDYVFMGKIRRFEAEKLQKALLQLETNGDGRALGKELIKILARR